MGYFKWKPNFFIVFVAPPGVVSKSTTVGVGMSILREVEGIHFGPDSATWQALTTAFSAATEMVDQGNGELLSMSALTIAASELGTFLDPHNREMIDVLVDLWDGRDIPWTRSTKGEGESTIVNPWINFIGCTTPSWIEGNFPEYAVGGGFTSRTVFVYSETKRHLTAYPKALMSDAFTSLRLQLVDDLRRIAIIQGEYILTADALEWGHAWYERHWSSKHSHLAGDRFGGYIARKQTHLHKLAMVLAASQRDATYITSQELETADSLISALEHNLPSVFNRISDNRDAKYSAAVFAVLRTEGALDKTALWQKCYHLMSHEQFELALTGIIRAGYCALKQNGQDILVSITAVGKRSRSDDSTHETSLTEHHPDSAPPSAAGEH
jgi:hypothetical protein